MLSKDDIRAQIAGQLGVTPASITDADNLIQQGLDSIRMMRLAGGWRKQGHKVTFAELAAVPTVHDWHQLLAASDPCAVITPPVLTNAHGPLAAFPLAPMQHAYWIGRGGSHDLGGVAAHLYAEFDGSDVDPARLAAAVAELVQVHPMLRAQFLADGTQRILPEPGLPVFAVTDLRTDTPAVVQAQLAELRTRRSHQRLRVEDGQVIDISLTLLPGARTRLHCDLDMLAADAMSYRTLMADLAQLYAGAAVQAPGYSYQQYLADRAAANDPGREEDRQWWQDRLDTLPPAPTLPLVPAAEQADPHLTVRHHHWLPAEAKARLQHAAHARGVTPAMALASVFAETIGRWSGEQRFLLNLPLFQRESTHPDIGRVVGDFSSSVMLDVDVSAPATVSERAHALQQTLHANGSHARYGGLEVLRDLGRRQGEPVLAPIVYTSALNLGELFADSVTSTFGEPVWIISQGPQVLLDAQVTEVRGGLLLNWDVRESAFPAGVIDAMFTAYLRAVAGLATEAGWDEPATPALPTAQLALREQVNATAGPVTARALHEGFFTFAEQQPEAPALQWRGGALSYGELARQALTIAGALRAAGVAEGDSVAVQLPKGHGQIVAILGVLAAGAAYVPISYSQPSARRAAILQTAQASAAICAGAGEYDGTGLTSLTLAEALKYPEPLPRPVFPGREDPAYVIFTSGSTGVPKGVEVPHRAAMNTVDAVNEHFAVGAHDRVLVISALEFDASVYDIFGLLSVGGSLVAMDDAAREDPYQWLAHIRDFGVTILNCVPSMLDMLLTVAAAADPDDAEMGLRAVLLGGDWVGADLPGRLATQVPGCRFAGLGGATETAIHFSVCEVNGPAPDGWAAVPFGTPLRNVRCRVVSPAGLDCADWVTGELWVGGAGVALGYRGDPDRTAARFVTYAGEKWYRTGDLARYWPDGTLEFLGRADHQVQLRGYRIELGEVESGLRAVDGVQLAVVVMLDGAAPKLVAAITQAGRTGPEILAELGEKLPAYMVPDRLLLLETMPLTSNGKLDRRAVQALLEQPQPLPLAATLATDLERALLEITAGVLGRRIGVAEDFFAAGGDSVLATTVIARIREWLDTPGAVVADFFATRTIAGLADRLTDREEHSGRLAQVAQIYLEVAALTDDEVDALTT